MTRATSYEWAFAKARTWASEGNSAEDQHVIEYKRGKFDAVSTSQLMGRRILATVAVIAALATPAAADPIDRAAFLAAQEYVCDYADFDASEAALAAVVAEGIPEDIAVEIIADLAWDLAGAVDPAEFCGVMVAGGFEP